MSTPLNILRLPLAGPGGVCFVADAAQIESFVELSTTLWQSYPDPNPAPVFSPQGVTWAAGIGILFTDALSQSVVEMPDISGREIRTPYNGGLPSGTLATPSGIAVYKGQIYVGDILAGLTQIGALAPTPPPVRLMSAPTDNTAWQPMGVVAAGDTLYVTDIGWARRVISMSKISGLNTAGLSTGKFSQYPVAGKPSPFAGPTGVAVDTNENVYVSDCGGYMNFAPSQIWKLGPGLTGPPKSLSKDPSGKDPVPLSGASGIAVDPRTNQIYIADSNNGRIVRVDDITGENWTAFGAKVSGMNPGPGEFVQPVGIFVITVIFDLRPNPVIPVPHLPKFAG